MSRCYLDTNFLYSHLHQSRNKAEPHFNRWRDTVLTEMDGDAGLSSALVVDELAYRSVLGWLRDSGEADPLARFRNSSRVVMRVMRPRLRRLWTAVDELLLEFVPTDQAVIERARNLMAAPGLAPRDAFHAAHAVEAGCDWIVSADADFDVVTELPRLGPG
jgi:predicted nucleic acid-binding protein